jgi:hypothetical protein
MLHPSLNVLSLSRRARRPRRLGLLVLAVSSLALLSACEGDPTSGQPGPDSGMGFKHSLVWDQTTWDDTTWN